MDKSCVGHQVISPKTEASYICYMILLMEKINQLRLVVYLMINRVLYILIGAGFLPSTVRLDTYMITYIVTPATSH